jgi:hypothetical protein
MGRTALRRIIDDPGLDLVGLYVYGDDKVGLDAGDIARRPKTGVLATNDIGQILALNADVVVHMPRITLPYEALNADVESLLASGKNLVSTAGFHWPASHGETYAAALLAACVRGGSTLAGMGVNPGFMVERLLLAATGLCASLEHMSVSEVVDVSAMQSASFVFDTMGFGRDPEIEDIRHGAFAELYTRLYGESLHFAAAMLGTTVTSVRPEHQLTVASADIRIAAGIIPRGRIAATAWQWLASFGNGMTLRLSILWTADPRLHGHEATGHWTLDIRGRPSIRMNLELVEPDPLAPPSRALADATVAVAMRAIPDVISAPPGFFAYPPVAAYRSGLGPR